MRRASDVIRVKMGQNYFSDAAAFLHQAINKCIEFSLFLFVWRGWVDDDQLIAADDVTVGVCGWRKCWRSNWKQKNARAKLDASHHSAIRFRDYVERRWQLIQSIAVLRQRSNYVKRGRRHNYLAAFPSSVGFLWPDPFTSFKLTGVDQCLLPVGHPPQKERSIESARREMGRHPSASRFEIRASNLQAVFLENLLEGRLTTLCRFSLRTDSLERQSFSPSREQHAGLLEELAHCACTHQRFFAVATDNIDASIVLVDLSAREGMKASHELELRASLDPKYFGVVSIFQQYY